MSATDPYQPIPYIIDEIYQESADVFSIVLSHPEAKPTSFKAGQFNMLNAFGIGECAISMSGDPKQENIITHTIRAVGPATKYLCTLKPKQSLHLRGPFGMPWPIKQVKDKSVLLIAGGIGLAPLRPVIYQLIKQQTNNITLLYGARTPDDIIFKNAIPQWAKQFNVQVTVDQATSSWHSHIGVVTSLIHKNLPKPKQTIVMICGPEVMMHFCLMELNQLHVPKENIYLSLERNMQCGFGHCGHCQWGPYFICKDGPVMNFKSIESWFYKKAL